MFEKRHGDMFIHRPFHIPSENDFLKLFQTHKCLSSLESKSRLKQIRFVHAIKSTKILLLDPKSIFEQESKTTSFEWMFLRTRVRMAGRSFEAFQKVSKRNHKTETSVSDLRCQTMIRIFIDLVSWLKIFQNKMISRVNSLDTVNGMKRQNFANFCSLIKMNQLDITEFEVNGYECCKLVAHCYQI